MKTLNVYRPNTIQNALSDLERHFEPFFGDSLLTPAARILNRINTGMHMNLPAVDIREAENAYILDMELPGYDEKNINVHVDGSNLTISSNQEEFLEEKGKEESQEIYILRERQQSSFSRSFKLPANANPDAVNAGFKNGILTLEIKKRAEALKRTIQINAT